MTEIGRSQCAFRDLPTLEDVQVVAGIAFSDALRRFTSRAIRGWALLRDGCHSQTSGTARRPHPCFSLPGVPGGFCLKGSEKPAETPTPVVKQEGLPGIEANLISLAYQGDSPNE